MLGSESAAKQPSNMGDFFPSLIWDTEDRRRRMLLERCSLQRIIPRNPESYTDPPILNYVVLPYDNKCLKALPTELPVLLLYVYTLGTHLCQTLSAVDFIPSALFPLFPNPMVDS